MQYCSRLRYISLLWWRETRGTPVQDVFVSLLLYGNKRYDLNPDSPDYDSFTAATFIASVLRSRAD